MSINSQSLRQRRRRVALDQNSSAIDFEADTTVSSSREQFTRHVGARPYSEGARRSRQFKTTDFIPKRSWTISGLAIGLLLAIVALNGIHYAIPSLEVTVGQSVDSAFSLNSSHGLNAWYCNFLLLLSVATSLQIYLLRQHRRDDYRGTYRVWLWFAAIFIAASIASVTSISGVVYAAGQQLVGLVGSAAFWLTLIQVIVLLGLVTRAMVEVRRSRLSVFSLATVFVACTASLSLQQIPEFNSGVSGILQGAQGNLMLIAASTLFFGTISFARYVYLEANGLLRLSGNSKSGSERKTRSVKEKADKLASASARQLKRKSVKDRSNSDSTVDSDKHGSEPDFASKNRTDRSPSSSSLLSKRSERNSTRMDTAANSGKKPDKWSAPLESIEEHDSPLSKSEQRRLRKQKRRAA